MIKRSVPRSIADFLFAPARLVLPYNITRKLKLTTLQDERIFAVLPEIKGKLLDVGAGNNLLVKTYGRGVGIDIYNWGGGALIVQNSARLPFKSESFDTITCLAALNHIPNRKEVVPEIFRLLRPGGYFIVTMIPLWMGKICHKIQLFEEHRIREVDDGELMGMSNRAVINLCTGSGFKFISHKRFTYKMNNLLKFKKPN